MSRSQGRLIALLLAVITVVSLGLGSAGTVSLAHARELAAQARAQLADKQNPLKGRKAEARTPTFGEVADAVLASLEVAWRQSASLQRTLG